VVAYIRNLGPFKKRRKNYIQRLRKSNYKVGIGGGGGNLPFCFGCTFLYHRFSWQGVDGCPIGYGLEGTPRVLHELLLPGCEVDFKGWLANVCPLSTAGSIGTEGDPRHVPKNRNSKNSGMLSQLRRVRSRVTTAEKATSATRRRIGNKSRAKWKSAPPESRKSPHN